MSRIKIVGIMPVYNEADILRQTIKHMVRQGVPLIVVEGDSDDGSLEIEREFLGKGVLRIEVVNPDPYHDRKAVLKRAYASALEYSPDWIVYCDADEFLESPYPRLTLSQAIENEAHLGYNQIQFNCFEFLLTTKDYRSREKDIRKKLRYYTWTSAFYFRAWKHYRGTDLVSTGGHKPLFPPGIEEKVSPTKFVLRHYKFRSYEHAIRKVFKERLPRYDPRNVAIGWHVHYRNLKPDPAYFIVDPRILNRYHENGQWDLERRFDPYFGAWLPPDAEDHLPPKERIAILSSRLQKLSERLDEISDQLQRHSERQTTLYNQLQEQFDAIYRSPPVRAYLALRKMFKVR